MGLSLRAFLIGILSVVAACIIVSGAELVVHNVPIGGLQLPPVALGLFVFLIGANAAAKRVLRPIGLSPQELLTIYCMTVMGAMISSRGLLQRVLPFLVTPAYFADETNDWASLYYPHIKKWLLAFQPDPNQRVIPFSSKAFFEGLKTGESIPWNEWIVPLMAWGVLALLVFGVFLCMASILRRQWVDHERLTFPLAQLPLEMVRDEREGPTLLRNRLTWLGFAVPALIFTLNGFHNMYPALPEVPLEFRLDKMFATPPWSNMGYTVVYVSFAAIGFFFLLPVEITLSLWFFFVLMRAQSILAMIYGMETPGMRAYPTSVFIGYQIVGAYLVLTGYTVYIALPHLKHVARAAVGLENANDDDELLPYRTAVFGMVICFLGAALWMTMAGMTAWLALLSLAVFVFVIALVMARSTAEAGLLMTESSFRPLDIYRVFAPIHTLGKSSLAVMMVMDTTFFIELRGLLLTAFLDSLKIAQSARIRLRLFLPAFVGSVVIAMVVGAIFQIWLPYREGAVNMYWYSYYFSNRIGLFDYEPVMRGPVDGVGWQGPFFLVVGATFTAFLAYMRYNFLWWPFHPIGYALCASWTILVFWFPCVVAWAIKSVTIRFGGMRVYRAARPLFLGMVLGEFATAVVWGLISWSTGIRAPAFPWP